MIGRYCKFNFFNLKYSLRFMYRRRRCTVKIVSILILHKSNYNFNNISIHNKLFFDLIRCLKIVYHIILITIICKRKNIDCYLFFWVTKF